jgi:hypothetical protein
MGMFKIKIPLLIVIFVLLYMGLGVYQLNQAHPVRVIYSAVYSEWNYSGSKILPFPFRRFFARSEFSKRNFSELESTPAFNMNLYTVFSLREFGTVNTDAEQKRLEQIADELTDKGLGLENKTSKGCDALKLAIINEDLQAVHYLVGKGLVLNDENMQPVLEIDNKNPCRQSVRYLLGKYLPEYWNNRVTH